MSDGLTARLDINYATNEGDDRFSLFLSELFTGNNYLKHKQNVGTSEEVVSLGDVAAGGLFAAQNLDGTNYVEIRPNTGVADLIRLDPGDFCFFRLTDDAVPYAIANTAACDVNFWIWDD